MEPSDNPPSVIDNEGLHEMRDNIKNIENELRQLNNSVQELLAIYNSMKGFLKVMKWAERLAIWCTTLTAAFYALKIGKMPSGE